jgi:hypothetical protein
MDKQRSGIRSPQKFFSVDRNSPQLVDAPSFAEGCVHLLESLQTFLELDTSLSVFTPAAAI